MTYFATKWCTPIDEGSTILIVGSGGLVACCSLWYALSNTGDGDSVFALVLVDLGGL